MTQDAVGQTSPVQVTADHLGSLAAKLETFRETLTPAECAVLAVAFGRAAAGDASGDDVAGFWDSAMMMATQQMQEMTQLFNMQYLMLQQAMQAENRQFSLLSNVMKTKHDTAKNSLSNLK